MAIVWLVWPVVLIVSILLLTLRQVLRRWYVPVGWGLAAFPGMFVTILILQYIEPNKPNLDSNLSEYFYVVRWWDRWRFFGVARLLSDGWITHHQPYPTDKEVLYAFLHVCLAASVTVAALVFFLIFLSALRRTLSTIATPFEGGLR